MTSKNKLITILGPTAVGKTKFAAQLAYKFDGEIISADSRQVYIGMDLGTGKDYDDYEVHNTIIKSHLIDIIKPTEEFDTFKFVQNFLKCYDDIITRNKIPFLVGGTGLFLSSILQQYKFAEADFESERKRELEKLATKELTTILKATKQGLHNTTDLVDKDRLIKAIIIAESDENYIRVPKLDSLVVGIKEDRELHKEKIRKRLKARLKEGLVQEAEDLIQDGITHDKLQFFGLEYKYLSLYLLGELNYNDMYQKLASSIIKFSKRQMTWFRKMEKEGINIKWLTINDYDNAEKLIHTFLEK